MIEIAFKNSEPEVSPARNPVRTGGYQPLLAARIREIRDSKTGRSPIFRFKPGPNGTVTFEVKGSEEVKRAVECALNN